jgi:hypothetical protein
MRGAFRYLTSAEYCTMRLLSLRRLAITVWLAWLGLLGLMAAMLAGRAWHPHFLPATTVLGVLIVAGLALVCGASWRIRRGPRRLHAFSCLLLGTAPLLFLAGHGLYGLRISYGREIPQNLPLKLLIPLGESLMDLEARFRYPIRTAGEKVVMISTPVADAGAQVAAMDRHVRALEARLGRTTPGTIHWVRGPLLGVQGGHAVFGLCLGTLPASGPVDAEALSALDRHEVAHCVLNSHSSPSMNPPALLTEGWAEANSGHDPYDLARRAWESQTRGDDYTLGQLTGPDWYNRHEWPVYRQGAMLVNILLERFGPDRFLELYTTCRPATFDADCRRILGVSVDELDALYRTDIARLMGGAPTLAGLLRHLKADPKVGHAAWQSFLDEYLPEVERLLAPYANVRLTSAYRFSTTDPSGKTTESETHSELRRSGPYRSLHFRSKDREEVELAHPRQSLEAQRKASSDTWEIREFPTMSPERSYRRILAAIDRREMFTKMAAALLWFVEDLQDRVDISAIVVARLERFTEGGRRFVRIRFEDRSPAGGVPFRSFTVVLSADDHFAVRSDEVERSGGGKLLGEFAYDLRDGVPVVRSLRNVSTEADGTRTTSLVAIVDRRFEPTPEDQFSPERLLAGAPVRTVIEPDPFASDPVTFASWYWVLLVAGALCLVAGVAAGLGVRSGDRWEDRMPAPGS